MAKAIADIASKHDLTYGELFSAMAGIQARWAQYQVRDERHPNDPDKPGGLA